jgi:2-phosphoglycerate kinase
MKKQTAVQYFASKVMYLKISPKEMHEFLEWFEESRKMEKEQIINANRDGVDMVVNKENFLTGEQYYNENYGKK